MAQSPQSMARAAMQRHQRGVRVNQRIVWYGDKIVAGLEHTFTARLRTVGNLLRDRMQAHIAIPVGFKIGPRGGIIVTQRSKPGEHPRTQMPLPSGGMLMRSIFADLVTHDWMRVGSTMDYSIFLELGTKKMAPRPFMYRTLVEQLPQLKRIFGAHITLLPGVPFASPNP